MNALPTITMAAVYGSWSVLLALSSASHAATEPDVKAPTSAGVIATVKVSRGEVAILRGQQKLPAASGAALQVSDRVATGADGAVGITMRDNTLLSAGPNSMLSLDRFAFDSTTHAGAMETTLKRGTLSVVSGKIAKQSPEAVQFRTPHTTLGVRGTEFVIEVPAGGD